MQSMEYISQYYELTNTKTVHSQTLYFGMFTCNFLNCKIDVQNLSLNLNDCKSTVIDFN